MRFLTTNKTVFNSHLDVAILHPDDHVVGEDLVQLDQEAATNHSSVLRPVDQSQISIAASGPITAQYSPAVHGDGREAVAPRGAAQSPRVGGAPELETEVAEDVRHAHGRGRQLRGPSAVYLKV